MDYNGEDLILVTGAPGSRWSATCRAITFNPAVNTTDEKDKWKYDHIVFKDGRKNENGWHRGAYWGPYHTQGHNFDQLDKMSKDQVLEEFMKPYTNFDYGIKMIKSHWFSYHLETLKDYFPKAKLVSVYMPDSFCFDWWHKVGGWEITYPHYNWYKNDDRIKSQIAIENSFIRNFFKLKTYTIYKMYQELDLPVVIPSDEELDKKDDKLKSLTNEKDCSYTELLERVVARNQMGIIA